MKHIVEAGTDAASLLLFDPLTLPEGFDAQADESIDVLDRLDAEERLLWINTEGDGEYLLHAFVDEQLTQELRPFIKDPRTARYFSVASGEVYFSGAEYGFRDDGSGLDRFSHMGGKFPVPKGKYRVDLFRVEYPSGYVEQQYRNAASPAEFGIYHVSAWTFAAMVTACLSFAISSVFLPWKLNFAYLLPLVLLLLLASAVLGRLPIYRRAAALWREIQQQHPSIVAVFSSQP